MDTPKLAETMFLRVYLTRDELKRLGHLALEREISRPRLIGQVVSSYLQKEVRRSQPVNAE